jgi:GAF domain-containing protein
MAPTDGAFPLPDLPLGESLAALSRFFVGDLSIKETLQRVSDHVTEVVPGADMVGLTMMLEGRPRTAVFTDEDAPEIDQAQYDTGNGPCLSAYEKQEIFEIPDTREGGPWPAFRAAALEHGVLSTLSLPMAVAGRSLGAMNLYSHTERGFAGADRGTAQLFATQAAIVLANTQAYWDARDLSERLSEAMQHRAVIEQAKGMLMVTQRCGEDEAFDLLVRASQRENTKLRDIAHRIVDNTINRARRGE